MNKYLCCCIFKKKNIEDLKNNEIKIEEVEEVEKVEEVEEVEKIEKIEKIEKVEEVDNINIGIINVTDSNTSIKKEGDWVFLN